MAEVRAFRAFRYDKEKIGNLDLVITPPFDVISPEERTILAAKSPYNLAHAILPVERDGVGKYEAAAQDVTSWMKQGVLKQDDADSFYLLKQTFRGLDGREHVRRGFFAVSRIPEAGDESILGHERTFEWKVTDRLELTKATKANLGAVFVLYDDPKRNLADFLAQMDSRPEDGRAVTIDGVMQQYWRVAADPRVTKFFEKKHLYIADGHHRYRTACTYRDLMRAAGVTDPAHRSNYVLMGYIDLSDPGLFVYPAHRVLDPPAGLEIDRFLNELKPWFEVVPAADNLIEQVNKEVSCTIGLTTHDKGNYLLRLRDIDRTELLGTKHGPAWRDLDVSVLHGGILERALGLPENAELVYEKDPAIALSSVRSGKKGMAFLLRNMHPSQVCSCAEAREFMPQKATYFFPKLPSGAVIHQLV